MDTHIHAYYGHLIASELEGRYLGSPIDRSVLAYRRLGRSNINFAMDAIEEIRTRRNVDVVAIDVEGFFDTLDHGVLKASCTLSPLPGLTPAAVTNPLRLG